MSPIKTKSAPATSSKASSKAGRTYGGMSQDERKQQRRRQFLQAGLVVFGTVGFRQATVRGLCREASLTDRYFYAEFGSIEKLLVAVYEDRMIDIHNQVMTAFATATPGTDVKAIITQALSAFYNALQNPLVARVCMVELEGVSPETDQLYHSYIQRFAKLILQFIRGVSPDWHYSKEEADILSIAMVGSMRQAGTYWLQNPDAVQKDTLIKVSTQLFMGVFREINQP